MTSNIPTRIALYLNDESELVTLFGRERMGQSEILGRAQIKTEFPTLMQLYLPTAGENDSEILENLEQEISDINASWDGARPEEIPMVSDKLGFEEFNDYTKEIDHTDLIYLGLNKSTAGLESLKLFNKASIGIFSVNNKQEKLISEFYLQQVLNDETVDTILLDLSDSLNSFESKVNVYLTSSDILNNGAQIEKELNLLSEDNQKRLLIVNGIMSLIGLLKYEPQQIASFFRRCSSQLQIIVLDNVGQVSQGYGEKQAVRSALSLVVFGGDLMSQGFVDNLPAEVKNETFSLNTLHVREEDEFYNVVIPKEDD